MKTLAAIFGGILLAFAPGASASLKGWLDFGPSTPGESTDPGHEGWAEVGTFSAGHDADVFKLTCHRKVDKASPLLMKACATGTHFPVVKLDVAYVIAGGTVNFWEITLKDVLVSSYTGRDGPDGTVAEDLSLTWKSLVFTYRVFPPGGTPYNVSAIISADTDRDGLPDAYEESVGLDPAVSNTDRDSDNDGLDDSDEYRLGTHPKDGTSFFHVTGTMGDPAAGELVLTWPSVSGEEYQVESSADLVTPFVPVATITATGAVSSHTVARTLPTGFFRVSKVLP